MKPYFLYPLGIVALYIGLSGWMNLPGQKYAAGKGEQSEWVVDTCFADTLICIGDTLRIGGEVIAAPGTYVLSSGLPPGCESALVLNVMERNNVDVRLDIDLCHGENARFGIYTFGRTGYYEIRLPGDNGCDTLIFLDLLVSDLGIPTFQTEPDDGSGNGSIDLSIGGDGLSFSWSNGADTEDLEAVPAGVYEVTITNTDSCQVVRSVEVEKLELFAAPNAFTPNADGNNDTYGPVNYFPNENADFLFLIYNRWGQKIYETNTLKDAYWDGNFEGQPSPAGVYIYYLRYAPTENQLFEEKGSFTLLR